MYTSMHINRRNPKPVFGQIGDALRSQIETGELKPGDAIPSERELSEQLRVSRMTVRAAIDGLVNDGLLYRQRGRNTIVSGAKINRGEGFKSFSEDMQARGLTPRSEVRRLIAEVAEASIAAQLGLAAGDRVVFIERLRLANDEPVALERVYLPYHRFGGLLAKETALMQHSLYELMEEEFDSRPTFADETVEAVTLNPAEARLLAVPRNSPALLAQRVTRDERGERIETVQTLYRADRYRMSFIRKR